MVPLYVAVFASIMGILKKVVMKKRKNFWIPVVQGRKSGSAHAPSDSHANPTHKNLGIHADQDPSSTLVVSPSSIVVPQTNSSPNLTLLSHVSPHIPLHPMLMAEFDITNPARFVPKGLDIDDGGPHRLERVDLVFNGLPLKLTRVLQLLSLNQKSLSTERASPS